MRAITVINIVIWGVLTELFWFDPNRNSEQCYDSFPIAIMCSRRIFHFALCALAFAICTYIVGRRPRFKKAALMSQCVLLLLFIFFLVVGILFAPMYGHI